MNKFASIVAGAVMVPALVFTTVSAVAAGQIEGGDIYRVKNVTKNTDFTDPASATCGDTVQFKVRVHNPGPDALTNVTVKATLPNVVATSHSSTATVSSENANPTSRTDTAGVNLDKAGKLSYVNGTTELLDANNSKLSTLGDTILTDGVNIGTVGVSTEQKRFVQFQAKVECETPPTMITVCELSTKKIVNIKESDYNTNQYSRDLSKCAETPAPGEITVCELSTKKIVNIKENQYNSVKYSKDLSRCDETPVAPAAIASTGPTSTIATMTGLSALAAGISYFVQRRRNILG